MKMRCAALAVLSLSLPGPVLNAATPLPDRVDTPAIHSPRALHEPAMALAAAGERVVAVGARGHVFWSTDQGAHWQQAEVPVSSDLTDVFFVSPQRGWAVGHDGVVLRSDDGGEHWQRQLDGHAVAALFGARAQALQQDDPELARRYQSYADQGINQSLMTVFFENENEGYVAGAYNLMLHTRDGGDTWTPWLEQLDNPNGLHLYAMQRVGDHLFIAGEQGLLLRQDERGGRFVALDSPYAGTWFGLAGRQDLLLVYGLRGNAWVSRDAGQTWAGANVDSAAALTGAALLPSGDMLLVSQSGAVLRSTDQGQNFIALSLAERFAFFDVLALSSRRVVVAGLRGLSAVSLPGEQP